MLPDFRFVTDLTGDQIPTAVNDELKGVARSISSEIGTVLIAMIQHDPCVGDGLLLGGVHPAGNGELLLERHRVGGDDFAPVEPQRAAHLTDVGCHVSGQHAVELRAAYSIVGRLLGIDRVERVVDQRAAGNDNAGRHRERPAAQRQIGSGQ